MQLSNYPSISYAGLERLVKHSAQTRRPLMVLSPPGIGKTASARTLARRIGRPLVWFDLGNGAREDAMLPVQIADPDGNPHVVRVPLEALMRACKGPVVLCLDEITRADKNKQAVAMAISNERRIGSYELHPDTVVLMFGNGAESSGTYTLVDAFVNRCCVVRLEPERDELRAVIGKLPSLLAEEEEPLAPLLPVALKEARFQEVFAKLAMKWSVVASMRTELLAIAPPSDASDTCEQWPSPRAIHHGLERLAANVANGEPIDETALAELGGCVGRHAAAAWFAIVSQENKLPSEEDIIANPKTARIPPDLESAIASMGVIASVHKRGHVDEAWIYLGAFGQQWREAQAAISRELLGKVPKQKEAFDAFNRIIGSSQSAVDRARGR